MGKGVVKVVVPADTMLGNLAFDHVIEKLLFVMNKPDTHVVSRRVEAKAREELAASYRGRGESIYTSAFEKHVDKWATADRAKLTEKGKAERDRRLRRPLPAQVVGTVNIMPESKGTMAEVKAPSGAGLVVIATGVASSFRPAHGNIAIFDGDGATYTMTSATPAVALPALGASARGTYAITPPKKEEVVAPARVQLFEAGGASFMDMYGGLISAYGHAVAVPPSIGNCGEIALMAYRMIVKTALERGVSIGVAAVSIENGNHSFVILGSSARFLKWLEPKPIRRDRGHSDWEGPARLEVPVHRLPQEFEGEVSVCDPWIKDGRMATFRAGGMGADGKTIHWCRYMAAVAEEAGSDKQDWAKAVRRASPAGGTVFLRVDDSIVVHAHRRR